MLPYPLADGVRGTFVFLSCLVVCSAVKCLPACLKSVGKTPGHFVFISFSVAARTCEGIDSEVNAPRLPHRAMNVLRTAFRHLALTLDRINASAISGAPRVAEVYASAEDVAAIRALGRRGGHRRQHRLPRLPASEVTADAGCRVICGWRPAARRSERPPSTLVYPAIARDANPSQAEDIQEHQARSKAFKIGHINIRSLVPKLDEVRLLIRQNELDALCVSESWLTKDVSSDILMFSGYQTVREDRKVARRGRREVRGGGLVVIIRDGIVASKLSVTRREDSRLETLWLAVSAPGGRSAVLGAAYRPPDGSAPADIDDLRHQLLEVSATGKPIYLLGDVNLDLSRPDKPYVTLYFNMIDELGFIQLIRDPTHPGATPSLLDHVLTNQTTIDHEPTVVKTHVSDHDMITVKTRLARCKNKPRWITTRSMRRVNYDQLCLDLIQADWSPLYQEESTSIDAINDAFLTIWNAVVNEHCPLKRVKLRHPDRPWLTMNDELQDLQTRRDAARRERDVARTKTTEEQYCSLKREFKRKIAEARADYFSAPSSTKVMWSQLRKHAIGPRQKTGPAAATDPETADRFNAYFADTGRRVADELASRSVPQLPPRPPIVCSSAFAVRPATLPELSAALGRMSGSRAVGCDGVSLQLIERCFAVIGPHVLRVINRSLVTGKVPKIWKHAKIIPIHKAGDVSQPCNFRPISILSVMSKLAEKLVSIQLMTYLTDNHILSPSQYAYRPHQVCCSVVIIRAYSKS